MTQTISDWQLKQRAQALELANHIRSVRSARRHRMQGLRPNDSAADAIWILEHQPCEYDTLTAAKLLILVRWMGVVRAGKMLRDLNIPAGRELADLTRSERERLIDELGSYGVDSVDQFRAGAKSWR